ncbi:sugar phosphate isomerase/epimerase family protein [Pseudomarimonas arenosa]|uniref:Sugar phosphate isomerase/epimerase n=1 Tax=Pseudomarimonas arenosa TaxID=2774145 RepID=A0AAW3ZHJ0_9GAMM|nr:TIM barrel protein [Pseudomarimonas arenosa]MBD8524885.1 sugar phosphate isomerase/epimerase [Pseudomarimonas arenosa]
MRLSISNIAWDTALDEQVLQLLSRHQIDLIDVAPTKYFADIPATTNADIKRVRTWWSERGVGFAGMQSLLFGTRGLNVFGASAVQQTMLEHLRHVCAIGDGLDARCLVFGSPRNRDCSGLSAEAARQVALDFFARLGDIAVQHGVVVCLEPNPVEYGCNFLTSTREAGEFVRELAHPGIGLQLDTGAATMAGESAADMITQFAQEIAHVHLSEPRLAVLGSGATDHAEFATALRARRPELNLTIEMLVPEGNQVEAAIEAALSAAIAHYR